MPYHIDKNNCVKKTATGETVKCHKTHTQALAHLRALEAAMSNEKAFTGLLPQAEVNYVTLSGIPAQACANCRWFITPGGMGDDGDGDSECHLVSEYPQPILATGLCDRWEGMPAPVEPEVKPMPVTIVPPEDDEEQMMSYIHAERDTAVEMPKSVWKKLNEWFPSIRGLLQPAPEVEPAFSVFKGLDNKHYWLARHTGKFIDREHEIIADKAHTEYVDRVQKGIVPLPELWTWHKKGTRHGQADLVWKSGGFMLALGHFDDTAEAKNAVSFYEKNAGKIKLSHMFNYPKSAKQRGVYHAYNTVEITTLPDGAEAFPYTSFEEIKPMTLTKEQREFIKGVGGDDMLKRVESADVKAVDDTKALEALGVESKGLDNFEGSTIPAAKDDLDALKTVQTDIETRLKAVEAMPSQLAALENAIKALTSQVAASQEAESQALKKVNELEKQLEELKALKPPASVSNDTVLDAREKSLLDMVLSQAKTDNSPSLIEKLVGGQPAVNTGA
jgi:hypothetical protein